MEVEDLISQEFSSTETLCSEQKYYCDACCSKQEAQKRMRIKRLPKMLALHLKRYGRQGYGSLGDGRMGRLERCF